MEYCRNISKIESNTTLQRRVIFILFNKLLMKLKIVKIMKNICVFKAIFILIILLSLLFKKTGLFISKFKKLINISLILLSKNLLIFKLFVAQNSV